MQSDKQWAIAVSDKIKGKMRIVAERNRDKIPYTAVNGRYDDWTDKNICWWTNGFWGGIMWQLYHATQLELYRDIAIAVEEKLDKNLMEHGGMDHDSGFKWLTTAGAHCRVDGSRESYNRMLLAADNLAGRINLAGGFLRAWNDSGDGSKAGWAIIDCMMNLPLLYRASEQTKDPRYRQIAELHAKTVMKYFVREDGSVHHIVEFNPVTGQFVTAHGGQGLGEGSSWTRGQAWAVYGFVLSFIHTAELSYLQTAGNVADYFITHIRENGAVPVDFLQPAECSLEDSSAAAIGACGMLELAKHLGSEGMKYREGAMRLLHFLVEHRCNWDAETDSIVEKCTAAYHDKEHEFPIIYGDYYLIEAIWKLTGEELFLW